MSSGDVELKVWYKEVSFKSRPYRSVKRRNLWITFEVKHSQCGLKYFQVPPFRGKSTDLCIPVAYPGNQQIVTRTSKLWFSNFKIFHFVQLWSPGFTCRAPILIISSISELSSFHSQGRWNKVHSALKLPRCTALLTDKRRRGNKKLMWHVAKASISPLTGALCQSAASVPRLCLFRKPAT